MSYYTSLCTIYFITQWFLIVSKIRAFADQIFRSFPTNVDHCVLFSVVSWIYFLIHSARKSRKPPPLRRSLGRKKFSNFWQYMSIFWKNFGLNVSNGFFRLFSKSPQRSATQENFGPKIARKSPKNRPQSRPRHWDHQIDDFTAFQAVFYKETEIGWPQSKNHSVRKSIYPIDNWPRECWDWKRCDIST